VPRRGLAIATTARPSFPSVTSLTVAARGRSGPTKSIIAGTSRRVKRTRFLVAVRNMESAPFCTENGGELKRKEVRGRRTECRMPHHVVTMQYYCMTVKRADADRKRVLPNNINVIFSLLHTQSTPAQHLPPLAYKRILPFFPGASLLQLPLYSETCSIVDQENQVGPYFVCSTSL
jgi:hypothetical protein